MSYKQARPFDKNRAEKRKGWCLRNVVIGFGGPFPGSWPSAKNAWERAVDKHPTHNYPLGVAVPVYADVSDPNEHIVVSLGNGMIWNDGNEVTVERFNNTHKIFGWAGDLCGQTIIEYVSDPTPPPAPEPHPAGFVLGDKVWPIEWVDYNGTHLARWQDNPYVITEIAGDRIVLNDNEGCFAALHADNLRKA